MRDKIPMFLTVLALAAIFGLLCYEVGYTYGSMDAVFYCDRVRR